MRSISKWDVLDELAKGADVYAVLRSGKKPMVEDAGAIPGRLLALYVKTVEEVDWYASEIEEAEDDKTE